MDLAIKEALNVLDFLKRNFKFRKHSLSIDTFYVKGKGSNNKQSLKIEFEKAFSTDGQDFSDRDVKLIEIAVKDDLTMSTLQSMEVKTYKDAKSREHKKLVIIAEVIDIPINK